MAGDEGQFVEHAAMERQPTGRHIDVEAGRAAFALGPQLRAPPSDWRHAATLLLGRPLLLALFLGFGVSLLTSGRFTLRLIVDGALSFAFVPLCEFAGFVAVYRVTVTSPPLSQSVDRFFAGNTPWLWWLLSIMVAASLLPAERHGSLMAPILLSAPVPIALSLAIDLRFFRDVMGRTTGRAVFDLALQRIIAWSAATAYFLGVAITTRDFLYLFVEMGQLVSGWAAELG